MTNAERVSIYVAVDMLSNLLERVGVRYIADGSPSDDHYTHVTTGKSVGGFCRDFERSEQVDNFSALPDSVRRILTAHQSLTPLYYQAMREDSEDTNS